MSQLEVDKIIPSSGTTLTIGDSGDSIDITSGATVTNFKSTGIDDNATSTEITIESGGDIGIGTTNPDASDFGSGTGILHLKDMGSNNTGIKIEDGTTKYVAIVNGGGDAYTGTWSNNNYRFYTNSTERMRIDNSGNVLVGKTSQDSGATLGTEILSGRVFLRRSGGAPIIADRDTNDGEVAVFKRGGTTVGNIAVTSSSTAYNTSSDYRLKENVIDLADATTRVKQLQPKRFNFIADADTTVDGFLAHEVSSVVPEAITGTHNEVQVWEEGEELPDGVSVGDNKLDDEGNTIPVYQGIDQSKLVPLLVATIKELEARIEALENA